MTEPTHTPDPLEKLQAAMKSPPAPTRRDAVRDAAMRAFDDEFSTDGAAAEASRQEPGAAARLSIRLNLIRRGLMYATRNTFRKTLMGGTAIAAIGLALVVVRDDAPADLRFAAESRPGEQAIAPIVETAPTEPEALVEDVSPSISLGRSEADLNVQRPKALRTPLTAAPNADVDQIVRPGMAASHDIYAMYGIDRDRFATGDAAPVTRAAEDPVSTFSVDVDTASYAWIRRALREGRLPKPNEVRVEEMINYFSYAYPAAEGPGRPFSVSTAVMDAPWAEGRLLLRIGLRGYEPPAPQRANYTFLIDTSGSMSAPDKLPLLLTSIRLMLDDLSPEDTVAIVTYAGSSTIALPPTGAAERGAILDALDQLQAGGGTAGAAGIETAYRLAEDRFDEDAVNRVILATDGDFNIGAASPEAMEALAAEKRDSGVFLSVLGFGRGDLNDALMQSLAQAGNGQAAYIDSLAEARKVLSEERRAMTPIASDVKIQVEFNPAAVEDYRLIGYETRALAREDFANDKVDAGEIGAGHRVTAIYEVTPKGGPARTAPLRYAQTAEDADGADGGGASADELAFLRLRWKTPGEGVSEEVATPIANEVGAPGEAARFAAAVAGFGQILRRSPHLGDWSYENALALAEGAKGADPSGRRAEFLELIRLARALDR